MHHEQGKCIYKYIYKFPNIQNRFFTKQCISTLKQQCKASAPKKHVDACNGQYVITYLCCNLQLQADSDSNNKVYTHNVICHLTAFGRTAHRTGNWIHLPAICMLFTYVWLPFACYLPMSGIWFPQKKTKKKQTNS